MKNIFVLAVVLSASMLNAQNKSIEEINTELAQVGVVMQEALALCYKKCDLIKAKDSDCAAAKDFVQAVALSCHEQCAKKAFYETTRIKEDVFYQVYKMAEEEYRNTHK